MSVANDVPSDVDHPAFSLWRNRDFLLLWSGHLVSTAGTQITDLALPLLVLALTGSPAQAGIVAACGAVPRFLLALPAGVLVDRLDRKRVMIACDVLRALALASIPVALALGRLSMPQLYLVSFVLGAGFTFFFLARVSALPRVVSREQLPSAVARQEAADSVVTLASPPLGGIIFGLGRALPFLADAISYVVSAISLGFIRVPFQQRRAEQESAGSLWGDMLVGMRWLWHAPLVRFMALVYAGFALFLTFETLGVIVRAQEQHATPLGIGLIVAAGGVGGLGGALLGPWVQRRFRFGQVLPVLHWIYVASMVLYALAPSPLALALVEAGGMANDQIYDIIWPSYRMALIPDALQGRVTSAYRLVLSSMLPVGTVLGGVLIQRLGASAALLVGACGLALLALAVTFNPHVRAAPPIDKL
jgi:predicted MFS family arabinose efflux permease